MTYPVFEVGDRVRVKRPGVWNGNYKNNTATVTELITRHIVSLYFDDPVNTEYDWGDPKKDSFHTSHLIALPYAGDWI